MPPRFCLQFFFFRKFCVTACRHVALHGPCTFSVEQRYLSVDLSTKSFSLWQWNCWSVYPRFKRAESSKLSIQRRNTLSLMECPIAKFLLMEAMQRMLYTRIQNKGMWADMYYAYNLVLKLSELHCNEPGVRGTSAFWILKLSLWWCVTKLRSQRLSKNMYLSRDF